MSSTSILFVQANKLLFTCYFHPSPASAVLDPLLSYVVLYTNGTQQQKQPPNREINKLKTSTAKAEHLPKWSCIVKRYKQMILDLFSTLFLSLHMRRLPPLYVSYVMIPYCVISTFLRALTLCRHTEFRIIKIIFNANDRETSVSLLAHIMAIDRSQ